MDDSDAGARDLGPLAYELDYLHKHLTALRMVLQQKGLIGYDEVLAAMDRLHAGSAQPGARVMARAWVDPAFKQRLLAEPKAACEALGIDFTGQEWELQVFENTDREHHVIVCTTCSCYATPLLGPQPAWYKSNAYRSKVVAEPRAVLRDFGLELGDQTDVRVVDTTRARRAIVLPRRPAGTAHLGEAELAALVTPESMIGVGQPRSPE